MDILKEILKMPLWGNEVRHYMAALGIFLGILILSRIFLSIILKRFKKWVKKTKTDIDDEAVNLIEDIPGVFYVFISFYIAIRFLETNALADKILNSILIILVIYWATKAAGSLIEFMLHKMDRRKGAGGETGTFLALNMIAKILIWSTGLLLMLSNLGVNITAFIASLGIGGIAVALAAQNILGDMFSSFSIYFDKPFEVGDYIVVEDLSGTVKKIGLKTTRVEALQGEEIVFSNRELTNIRVRNYKKMKKRRIVFGFGVTYDTPVTKIKKIPELVMELFKAVDKADIDRAHFKEFGDYSLNFEVVYYINSSEYLDYMDAQQKINLAIMEAFEKEGIAMAYPTQTVYLGKEK